RRPKKTSTRGLVGGNKPQHAPLDALEQAHPRRPHRRHDLVSRIEAREYKTARGKPLVQTARNGCRPLRAVADLVAVRHPYRLLHKEATVAVGQYNAIGNNVVDEVSAERAWVSHIGYLDRRRPARERGEAVARRVAIEVDQDVDVALAYQAIESGISEAAHV